MLALREVQRMLRALVPNVHAVTDESAALEIRLTPIDAPRTKASKMIEDEHLVARDLPVGPGVGFAAFLDGVQESRPADYLEGIPLVIGYAAAAIRVRGDRRMSTWPGGHRETTKLYVPRQLFPATVRDTFDLLGYPVVDTLAGGLAESTHPYELVRLAVHAVQTDRERLERELAETWCLTDARPLYVDGGLPWGERSSRAACCIGVVKSHHTLYAADREVRTVLSLPRGMRTSVFLLERQWGPTVASWYLRLRGTAGHDPMWGLVRVEVAIQAEEPLSDLTVRADTVSSWILAERAPLSLPDSRWHAMAYGVRDCEEYLRAVAK